jgi:hypothetical protein
MCFVLPAARGSVTPGICCRGATHPALAYRPSGRELRQVR